MQNQILSALAEQVRKLFHTHDQSRANEAAPVGVPATIDLGRISWAAYIRFFRFLLIVAVPRILSESNQLRHWLLNIPFISRDLVLSINGIFDDLLSLGRIRPFVPRQQAKGVPD